MILFQSTPPRGRRPRSVTKSGHFCLSFNPRLRVGGDRHRRRHHSRGDGFNPRLRVGGDSCVPRLRPATRCFNPRLRVGGDHGDPKSADVRSGFNPRLRVGGDPTPIETGIYIGMFQSTPPRGRRPITMAESSLTRTVSIHASAWEATSPFWPPGHHIAGFNPRLRVGGDSSTTSPRLYPDSFNPRLRVGGDVRVAVVDLAAGVSIHASAWEATLLGTIRPRLYRSFNPRLRVGGDCSIIAIAWQESSFNPRLRVGGDGMELSVSSAVACFNPRLRVGGDWPLGPVGIRLQSFNPRLRVGGDC